MLKAMEEREYNRMLESLVYARSEWLGKKEEYFAVLLKSCWLYLGGKPLDPQYRHDGFLKTWIELFGSADDCRAVPLLAKLSSERAPGDGVHPSYSSSAEHLLGRWYEKGRCLLDFALVSAAGIEWQYIRRWVLPERETTTGCGRMR